MKILIVEDEKISQKKMELIMAKHGICDAVGNGHTAVSMFKKSWQKKAPYDLVTMDITIHEMSGLEVLMKIREFEQEQKIPSPQCAKVIMVTSHKDADHITSCVTAGANDYVIKPFTDETISRCMKKIFLKHIQQFY